MAEYVTLAAAGVEVAGKIIDYFRQRKEAKPEVKIKETKAELAMQVKRAVNVSRIEYTQEKRKPSPGKQGGAKATKVAAKAAKKPSLTVDSALLEDLTRGYAVLSPRIVPHAKELLFMHGCLCKADADLSLYSSLLSKTTGNVKDTLLVLGPHFQEKANGELDLFFRTLIAVPPEIGDFIKGGACVDREVVDQKWLSANQAAKTKLDAGRELNPADWVDWLDSGQAYVRCYLEGIESIIVSKP